MGVACSGGAGGVYCVEGGGGLERQCPDVEVQHPRKWGYPDVEEQGAL